MRLAVAKRSRMNPGASACTTPRRVDLRGFVYDAWRSARNFLGYFAITCSASFGPAFRGW